MKQNTDKPQLPKHIATNRTFKCLGCEHYDVEVINDKGGTARICKVQHNDPRIIVDLDTPNCTD